MTAPAGPISLALEYLRETLGKSATFRTWTGSADQAAAEAKIHKDALPKPASGGYAHTLAELQTLRPYAIIFEVPEEGFHVVKQAQSESADYVAGGEFGIILEWDVPANIADDPAEIAIQWRNTYGQIIDDMTGLGHTPGYLAINRIVVSEGPWRSHEDDLETYGDVEVVLLHVEWGVQS